MVKKEEPCKDIIEDLFTSAEKVLGGANKWVK
jgi:enoyl-[acyl-carrier protein] reductase II